MLTGRRREVNRGNDGGGLGVVERFEVMEEALFV
jgi:hypothetical protein